MVNSLYLLLFLLPLLAAAGEDFNYNYYVSSHNPKTHKLPKEKLTHFRVYFHDTVFGKTPTAVRIINPPDNTSSSGFGTVNMMDDPLTESPDIRSKLVGRAQGFYVVASQQEVAMLMAMNFVFVEGNYNGSSIAVLGRNPVFNGVREMPVVGGSGLFRWARGYVQARTRSFDSDTGDAIVQYNVYVMHVKMDNFALGHGTKNY